MFSNWEKQIIIILLVLIFWFSGLLFLKIQIHYKRNNTIASEIETIKKLTPRHVLYKTNINFFNSNNDQKKININLATEKVLCKIPGIGNVLARRIIEYRNVNKGIKDISELINIPGISKKKYKILCEYFTTTGSNAYISDNNKKINLNFALVEDLEKVPGIDKSLAKLIINYRNQRGILNSNEDLYDIYGLSESKIRHLMKYVEIK